MSGVTLSSGETLSAPVVVNVAGPHSAMVNQLAGVVADMRILTRPLRHEVHHIPAPPGVDFEHNGIHMSDGDSGIYCRPEVGNNILIGSEDPECDPREWVDDPDDYDEHVSQGQWEAQVLRLARRMPSLEIPMEPKGLVSLYDVSDDWIPIYDRSELPGYYMAHRHQREPVQERRRCRTCDGGADRRVRERIRTRPKRLNDPRGVHGP